MNQNELNIILDAHAKWLRDEVGERANLRGANLSAAQPERCRPERCQPERYQPERCQPERCQPERCQPAIFPNLPRRIIGMESGT